MLCLLDIKYSQCFVLNLTCKSDRAMLTEIEEGLYNSGSVLSAPDREHLCEDQVLSTWQALNAHWFINT